MSLKRRIRSVVEEILRSVLRANGSWIIALKYGDFWSYRNSLLKKGVKLPTRLYNAYLNRYNCFIGLHARIEEVPEFPHGLSGVFISNSAKIGRGVIIFHHVTIGSNGVKGSKGFGAPDISDGVLIGAGAKVIGNVRVGRNARIGAGCIVTSSVPDNSTVVMAPTRVIQKESLVNEFVPNQGEMFKQQGDKE